MSGSLHPVGTVPGVLQTVRFVKDTALGALAVPWPRCQDLTGSLTGVPYKEDLVLAVSHAWPCQVHPDPFGEKAPYIQELAAQAVSNHKPRGNTLLFFDHLSVPQQPFAAGQAQRSKAQDDRFAIGLKVFPQIYLTADAAIHLDVPLSEFNWDGGGHLLPPAELDGASLQAVGPSARAADSEPPLPGQPAPAPVDSAQAVRGLREAGRAPKEGPSLWRAEPEPATLWEASAGKRNLLPADARGWIYLERFASMVKVAMTHESQIEGLVLSNSQELRDQILQGGARLRAAAADGSGQLLRKALDSFVQELNGMQFAAASADKQSLGDVNASAYPHSDRDMVRGLMQEMVHYLADNWASERKAQEHRQLQLAVGRQDVEGLSKLLRARANPNTQDAQGLTVLHEAAKIKNLRVITTLLEHGADCRCQDSQGNMPAHWVPLRLESTTIPAFRLLAPTQRELGHRNAAGVSPLERFARWARTAWDGAPFQPAWDVVDALVCTYPGILQDEANDEAGNEDQASTDVVEKMERYEIGGREVAMKTWEHKDGGEHHVLYLYFGPFLPAASDEQGVRALALKLCGKHSVRLHRIDYEVLAPDEYSAEVSIDDVLTRLCDIIEALPLNPQFVLCENSSGMVTPLLWRLRHRLVGGMVVNFGYYFNEDFEGSEDQRKLTVMLSARAEEVKGHLADKYVAMVSGPLTYSSCAEALAPIKRQLAEDFAAVPRKFWEWNMHCIRKMTLPQTEFFRKCQALQPPMPMRVTCGAQAPGALYSEASLRLRRLLPGVESVSYLPGSKCCWQLEGEHPQSKMAELLGSVVDAAFATEAVEP